MLSDLDIGYGNATEHNQNARIHRLNKKRQRTNKDNYTYCFVNLWGCERCVKKINNAKPTCQLDNIAYDNLNFIYIQGRHHRGCRGGVSHEFESCVKVKVYKEMILIKEKLLKTIMQVKGLRRSKKV